MTDQLFGGYGENMSITETLLIVGAVAAFGVLMMYAAFVKPVFGEEADHWDTNWYVVQNNADRTVTCLGEEGYTDDGTYYCRARLDKRGEETAYFIKYTSSPDGTNTARYAIFADGKFYTDLHWINHDIEGTIVTEYWTDEVQPQ